ncbi:MAG TPA: alpha-ketoglutarate-dependent dioxygenase AlkB [Acidimicrobiales bacterium]|nr:alpha-ketoglutarate-dependent dioxygenase AlkB [Acidimicrobiales bacterium]
MVLQGSLLTLADGPGPRPLRVSDAGTDVDPGPGAMRTVLPGGAWVDLHRAWMAGADPLFERLLLDVPWRTERRRMYDRVVDVPRMMAFYAEGADLPDPALAAARRELDRSYGASAGEPFCTVGMALYRSGDDSVAWHGDTIGRGSTEDTTVAILSLGFPRTLLLRPRGKGSALRFDLAGGDLLVMGGSCQRTWEHSVPKTRKPVGPRISVQFRPRGVR